MKTIVEKKVAVCQQIEDIILDVTWSKIAKTYFGKSPSWIYHKLKGISGNGGDDDFTLDEKIQLRNALLDFSERVRMAADNIII